jgi:hypothetical protein
LVAISDTVLDQTLISLLPHPSLLQAQQTSSDLKERTRSDESSGNSQGGSVGGRAGGALFGAIESAANKLEGVTGDIALPEFPDLDNIGTKVDQGSSGETQSGPGPQGFKDQLVAQNAVVTTGLGGSATPSSSSSSDRDRLVGVSDGALEGLSEQARLTAAVMGAPYVASELAALSGNAPTALSDCAPNDADDARAGTEGMAAWGEGGDGSDETEMQAQITMGQGVDPVAASAAAQIEEEKILIRVSAGLGKGSPPSPPTPSTDDNNSSSSSSSASGSADNAESGTGFSGGRVYDSTGSADFAWGVGEVVKESGYYAYRSVDGGSNTGIGRRSSTGHRGAGDEDATA